MAAALLGAALGAGASIYGANKAADTAKKAAKQQQKGIQQGIDESQGYYDTSQNYLSPYVNQGQAYSTQMANIAGLNGAEGGANALEAYRNNPSAALLKGVQDETFRRGLNTWAAAGGANSGRAVEDLSRRMSEGSLQDYYQWQGLNNNLYGTGANAAGAAANLAANRGNPILGARSGQGTAAASGTAAGGLFQAAGMNNAANYLANAAGKTDFSKLFQTAPTTMPGQGTAMPAITGTAARSYGNPF